MNMVLYGGDGQQYRAWQNTDKLLVLFLATIMGPVSWRVTDNQQSKNELCYGYKT